MVKIISDGKDVTEEISNIYQTRDLLIIVTKKNEVVVYKLV